jgi:hypothetical protein
MCVYCVGNIVTARVQVKSQASLGRVAKLLYKAKGRFVVKAVLNSGSYMLQRWNAPESAIIKFHGSDLYLLPPCIQPCEPLDTPDLRYLNQSQGMLVNPLHKVLDIKLFNDQWFDGTIPTDPPVCKPVVHDL